MLVNGLLFRISRIIETNPLKIFVIWAYWLSFFFFSFGPASYIKIHEEADSNIPGRLGLAYAFKHQLLGYWCPHWGAGVDRLALGHANWFDGWLFSFFPGWLTYGVYLFVLRWIAGYFTYRLLKDSFKLMAIPALWSGMAYALFAHSEIGDQWLGFSLYDGFGLPAIPMVLWFFSQIQDRSFIRGSLEFICVLTLIFVNNQFQAVAFLGPFWFFWFLFIDCKKNTKFWLIFFGFFTFYFLLATPSIRALLYTGPLTHRNTRPLDYPGSETFKSRLNYVSEILVNNWIPIITGLVGLIWGKFKDRKISILLFIPVISLILFVESFQYRAQLKQIMSIIYNFPFDRILWAFPFSFCIAAGFGLNCLLTTDAFFLKWIPFRSRIGFNYLLSLARNGGIILLFCSVIGTSFSIVSTVLYEMLTGSSYAIVFNHPTLLDLRKKTENDPPFRVASIADDGNIWQQPSYSWAYGFETVDGYIHVNYSWYHDYWAEVIRPLLNESQKIGSYLYSYYGYYGNRINMFSDSAFTKQGLIEFNRTYNSNLLSLANVRFFFSYVPLITKSDELVLLDEPNRNAQFEWRFSPFDLNKFFKLIRGKYAGNPIYIYENKKVFPRFFLASQTKSYPKNQLLTKMAKADYNELRSTAFFSEVDGTEFIPILLEKKSDLVVKDFITVKRYEADLIDFEVDAPSPRILIITNNYNEYWKAWVNEVPVKVFNVDYTFQGLYLNGGKQRVILKYLPPYRVDTMLNKLLHRS